MQAPYNGAVQSRQFFPSLATIRQDLPAGLVVFLVALPLCLGIALASGAPPIAGLVAGICGGLIVPLISRSALSVSGPAAGLTAIVVAAIADLGSFNAFLTAVVLAGLIQIVLGALKAGGIGALVPSSVIKGMLAAIGLILILKQLPHAVGYDVESFGADAFVAPTGENTFSLITHGLAHIELGAVIISIVCLAILIIWPKTPMAKVSWLPAPLFVVLAGVGLNTAFATLAPELTLGSSHLVALPAFDSASTLWAELPSPNWEAATSSATWGVAVTVALVASIETLLCVEAVDSLDPQRRLTPTNRELIAQGMGNAVSGLLGGLPITSVIVRSSANLASGAKSRLSAIIHGVFLLAAVLFAATYLALIPLACLAAILLVVGYRLIHPAIIRQAYTQGAQQFVPFVVTVSAIMFTDLLRGVIIGLLVGLASVLRQKMHHTFTVTEHDDLAVLHINKDVSFIHEATLVSVLRELTERPKVEIDVVGAGFMDHDIRERIRSFVQTAEERGQEVILVGMSFDEEPKAKRPKVQAVLRKAPSGA